MVWVLQDYHKRYVAVYVYISAGDDIKPIAIKWNDKKLYKIDSVLNQCSTYDKEKNTTQVVYTIKLGRHVTSLWYESKLWCVYERRITSEGYDAYINSCKDKTKTFR